jgi:serine protease
MYASANLGTSFSAPMVSGIAALMASVNPNLNSCQTTARLKEGAQPFPQVSAGETAQPPLCHVPTDANDLQTLECVCTLDGKTCGAGMANARAAVAAALRPIAAIAISVVKGNVTLDASGSAAALNHTLTAYQWRAVSGVSVSPQGAGSATASLPLPACGLATVQLMVTDDAGRTDIAAAVLSPTGAVSMAPTAATQRNCSAASAAVEVDVCPQSAQVTVGSGTLGFSASAANTSDAVVTWQVNGIAGGNATVGTISSDGVFTAPTVMPATASETITAVADADSTVTANAVVTLTVAGSAATASSAGHGGGGGFAFWSVLLLAMIWIARAALLRRSRL